jgi:hypothetical protein
MRAMGVPARVVTGYQGAELNTVDGQYIVRNSQAHAWAEIWLRDQGWTRVDPTAAVAPERVEQAPPPRPLALLPGTLGNFGQFHAGTLLNWRAAWEAMDHRWNVWVLQYGSEQQMDLLKRAGWSSPNWQDLGQALAIGLGLLGLAGSIALWLQQPKRPNQTWPRTLRSLQPSMLSLGIGQPPGPTPAAASSWRAWCEAAWPGARSALQNELLTALNTLDALQYGRNATEQAAKPASRRQTLRHIQRLCRDWRRAGAHSQT